MVTLADPQTREELVRIVESGQPPNSLDEFVRALSLGANEREAITEALRILPDWDSLLEELPESSPDLIKNLWWA